MWSKIRRWFLVLVVAFFGSTILVTVVYKFLPVCVTPLMVIRTFQQVGDGESVVWHHKWVPLEEISPYLIQAVVASEDNRFMEHCGFDFIEINKAVEENKTRSRPRGASTISQQTAKNVFLWPKSSYVRKGFEVYFTFLIEIFWGKRRIMEVYLNSIEMGRGIYGAQAAARWHFNTTADKLSRSQCALVAATLPNPLKYDSSNPSAYMQKRRDKILRLMKSIGPVDLDSGKNRKKQH